MNGEVEKIGNVTVPFLLERAEQIVAEKTKGTVALSSEAEKTFPRFDMKELTLGRSLGRGGFCIVTEVTKITLKEGDAASSNGQVNGDEYYIHNHTQDRSFMAKHWLRNKKDYRYAIKRLHNQTKKDAQTFAGAVIDLAMEARFLSVIRHANIIKMRAMADTGFYTEGFFLILDKLYDILPTRIKQWKKKKGGSLKKMITSKDEKVSFFVERMAVAYDLACALSYLHSLCIIYRDLKPENIGFDVRGDVKIFDFGLAKELDRSKRDENGTYNLTGVTGSFKYMAPEVYLSKPYNETADTYAFSILCWQILAIDEPYDHIKTEKAFMSVFVKGVRPKIKEEEWGANISKLLREGFADNPNRPSMSDTCERLRREINTLSDRDLTDGFLDESRRSRVSNASG